MSDLVQETQQGFWRAPIASDEVGAAPPAAAPALAETCSRCGTEFMIGSRFCYCCGHRRPEAHAAASTDAAAVAKAWTQFVTRLWTQNLGRLKSLASKLSWPKIALPEWPQYLHFHEIKRWIGLPTASMVAFFVGLGCALAALCAGLMTAKTFVDWEAVQFYRGEWLLAATASFVAGILLKKPPRNHD